jgi:AcrR family transcriptional regulator
MVTTGQTRQRLPGEERRALILEAAATVFGARGFEATRMEDVADEAGVAKGLLYKHFPSKDALFEALADEHARAFSDELRAAIREAPASPEPQAVLRRGLSLWLAKVPFHDPGVHDAYEVARNRVREVIAEVIRRVEPRADEGASWLLAAAIQGAAESAGLAWRERPGALDGDQALELLTELLWSGLSGLRPEQL